MSHHYTLAAPEERCVPVCSTCGDSVTTEATVVFCMETQQWVYESLQDAVPWCNECEDEVSMEFVIAPPINLAELEALLNRGAIWYEAPMLGNTIDLAALPTFGGRRVPAKSVLSWDPTTVLVLADDADRKVRQDFRYNYEPEDINSPTTHCTPYGDLPPGRGNWDLVPVCTDCGACPTLDVQATYSLARGWVMDEDPDYDSAYCWRCDTQRVEIEEVVAPPRTLLEMAEMLGEQVIWFSAPMLGNTLDLTALPTFGGNRVPGDDVLSWDATHVLMFHDQMQADAALITRHQYAELRRVQQHEQASEVLPERCV